MGCNSTLNSKPRGRGMTNEWGRPRSPLKPKYGLNGPPKAFVARVIAPLTCHRVLEWATSPTRSSSRPAQRNGGIRGFSLLQRERPAPFLVAGLSPVKLWSLAEASALLRSGPRRTNYFTARSRANALSLSHLTYRSTTTIRIFHSLDHPPFPCSHKLERPPCRGQATFFDGTERYQECQ